MQPVLETIKERFLHLGIREDIYADGTIVTADTGFANEANMKYLHENNIDAYVPDNKFRSRDPKFQVQKETYGKRHQKPKKEQTLKVIPASEFNFDPVNLTCVCPADKTISLRGVRESLYGSPTAYFEGRLSQCKNCTLKYKCMKNPSSANHRKGKGRQVSFTLDDKRKPTYTDWMKHRIDSPRGKQIYSHRMSVVGKKLLLHFLHFHHPWWSTGVRQHWNQQRIETI